MGTTWVRLLWPWELARRIYGPFGLPQGDLGALGGGWLSRMEPLLEVVLTARAWLTLNVVALVVQLVVDGLDDVAESVLQGGMVTMVLGPFGLLLGVAVLVVVARGAQRLVALRQLARPVWVAVVTFLVSVGVFGLQLPGVRQTLAGMIDPVVEFVNQFPLSVLAPLLGLWFFVFGLCAIYLIHRHAFSSTKTGGGRLLDPLVSVWLAWTVAGVEINQYDEGDLSLRTFATLTIASATTATVISVGELVILHRRGITFRRGPWTT